MGIGGFTARFVARLWLFTTLGFMLLVTTSAVLAAPGVPERGAPSRLSTQPAATAATPIPTRLRSQVAKAMRSNRCATGLVAPTPHDWSALVIVGGSVRHVPSDRGWSVFTGARPGQFIALCRGAT